MLNDTESRFSEVSPLSDTEPAAQDHAGMPATETASAPQASFASLGEFAPALLKNLHTAGITNPTPVQNKALPVAMEGRDLLVKAPTGSGKTLAFTLPLLSRLSQSERSAGPADTEAALSGKRKKASGPQALILCPTRELAAQVSKVVDPLAKSLGMGSTLVSGGMSQELQRKALKGGATIVIGTPGRVADLLRQGILVLDEVRVFVLDEVDQMLQVGFQEELTEIGDVLPEDDRQTLFFSATLDPRTHAVARRMLRQPHFIDVQDAEARPGIQHHYLEVRHGAENKVLNNLLHTHEAVQSLIFCERKTECEETAAFLSRNGFRVATLHGDLQQSGRNAVLSKFQAGQIDHLVATNVAARGLHVDSLPLVINLSVPHDAATYTHRVGRTGRSGASGVTWTFVTETQAGRFKAICRELDLRPTALEIPTAGDVHEKHMSTLFAAANLQAPDDQTVPKMLEACLVRARQMSSDEQDALLLTLIRSYLGTRTAFPKGECIPRRPLMRWPGESDTSHEGSRRASERSFGHRRERAFGQRRERPFERKDRQPFGSGTNKGKPPFGRNAKAYSPFPSESSSGSFDEHLGRAARPHFTSRPPKKSHKAPDRGRGSAGGWKSPGPRSRKSER